MNRTNKAVTIGIGTGISTYIGTLVHYIIESMTGDLPTDVDGAIVGLTVAVAGFLLYRLLPRGELS